MPRPARSAGRTGLAAVVVVAAIALAACSGAAATVAPASAAAPASAVASVAPSPAASPSAEASVPSPAASTPASTKPSGGRYGSGGSATASPSAAAPAADAVTVVDFGFNPVAINVKAGATVTWTNTGVTHTVTSDKGLFDSGAFKSGETFTFTFAKPGTYTYHCAIHSSMRGSVAVAP